MKNTYQTHSRDGQAKDLQPGAVIIGEGTPCRRVLAVNKPWIGYINLTVVEDMWCGDAVVYSFGVDMSHPFRYYREGVSQVMVDSVMIYHATDDEWFSSMKMILLVDTFRLGSTSGSQTFVIEVPTATIPRNTRYEMRWWRSESTRIWTVTVVQLHENGTTPPVSAMAFQEELA
jgi:hypothetical protein